MAITNNINLPISSTDPLLGLFDLYTQAFSGVLSEYVDVFEKDELKFDLYTKTDKYLGEGLFYISSEQSSQQVIETTQTLFNGQNTYNPFNGISDGISLAVPLSSTNISDIGGTAGAGLNDSDIIWQFVDGTVEGAWLKGSNNETFNKEACIKLTRGVNEFKFPYPNRGLSGEGLEWTGKGVDNCNTTPYLSQSEQQIAELVEGVYWSDDTSVSASSPISLNQTSLITNGSTPSKDINESDTILVKPSRESKEYNFAWLFDFTNTELPISCGDNNIYFPLFKYDGVNTNFGFNIDPTQTEDIALSAIDINKSMAGAIAGTKIDNADQLLKKYDTCGTSTEGAWLSSSDINYFATSDSDEITSEIFCDYVKGQERAITFGVFDIYSETLSSNNYFIGLSGYKPPVDVYGGGNECYNIPNTVLSTTVDQITSTHIQNLEEYLGLELEDYFVLDYDECNVSMGYKYNAEISTGLSSIIDGSLTWSIGYHDNVNTVTLTPVNNVSLGVLSADSTEYLPIISNTHDSVGGSARQSGLFAFFPPSEYSNFFWEFPNTDATQVINGYEHDEYCEYNKINTFSSIISPRTGDEQNQWKKCNCKAVYYSPIGNNLNDFNNFTEFQDIIYLDVGVEPFSLATWKDEQGRDYRESDQFAVFKYSGREPDVGYGIGIWETLNGEPLILQRGRSYVYKRASFGGCVDTTPPPLVINNPHCYDSCNEFIAEQKWIKMVRNSEGGWVSTGEPTDMVIESSRHYQYIKQGKLEYNIRKNKQTFKRITETPSFSINIAFESAKPYWAESPNVRGYNVGLSAFETDNYLLTTQPKPSSIILTDDIYVKYERKGCDPVEWRENVEFTINQDIENTWRKIRFTDHNPNLLKKIVGCGSCEIVFGDTPVSCHIKENNCDSFFTSVEATNEHSDMLLRTPINCDDTTEFFYYAQKSFEWVQSYETISNITKGSEVLTYIEASKPWGNLLNTNTPLVRIHEKDEVLKTQKQLGVFKPQFVGLNKLQCFGVNNEIE